MTYLIIDDEHILYRTMFSDIFKTKDYNVKEIPRMVVPKILKPLYNLHYNRKINSHIFLPFKMIWSNCYQLHKYPFDDSEEYVIIFLNGSLRFHFSNGYLKKVKKKHPNVKLAMIMYDSFVNPAAKRSISMIPTFDYVFSFDKDDCEHHNLNYIYSTFSYPDNIHLDNSKHTSAFFIGYGSGRLKLLQDTFRKITSEVQDCYFGIAGVSEKDIVDIRDVHYNVTIPYSEELQMAYNTDCVVEVVKEGQTGVSLRTCEAIAFNKKLLTNNVKLKEMPFYDSRFMSVFNDPNEIDIEFVKANIKVKYNDSNIFSPINILKKLESLSETGG